MLNKLQAMRKNLKKKGKGFTLVELIVVIIIIAIIAAVAIPSITSFQDNARRSRVRTEHRQLISAIQSWKGTLDDPTDKNTVGAMKLSDLYPYISGLSAASSDADFTSKMAKNGAESAHKIDSANTKLISEFKRSGKTTVEDKDKWEYNYAADAQ